MSKTWLPVVIVALASALRLWAIDRLPPGLYADEAANGIDALRVLAGHYPIFFTGNQGREPLAIYAQAVAIWLVGPTPLALRLPAVAFGILTVAATYATFRALFGERVGLLGSFFLAASFWHLELSRLGFRTASLPLFATLAVFWLWRGIRSERWRDYALAGIFLAIDLYTYIPARLVPAILAIWFVGTVMVPALRHRVVLKSPNLLSLLRGGGITVVCFVVAVFPLAQYFWLHPSVFLQRINAEASTRPAHGLVSGFVQAIAGLVWTGDANPRQDLPGLPLIAIPVTLVGLLGLYVVLRRRDAPSLLAVIWCAAMLAPAALSPEPAHGLRLAGEIPFIFAFPALGLDWLLSLPRPRLRLLGVAWVTATLAFVAIATPWEYFVVWGHAPSTAEAFQFDALDALRLIARVPSGHPVFASTYDYAGESIPLRFDPSAVARARAFDGRQNFVFPADGPVGVYYVYPRSLTPTADALITGHLTPVATVSDRLGVVDGYLFFLQSMSDLPQPSHPADATILSTVYLRGSDVTKVVQPGQDVHFVLWWNVLRPPPSANWEFFAHLVARNGHKLIIDDYDHGFPLRQWRTGDQVISWFTLHVPASTPAGVADVDAGLLDPTSGTRLPLTDTSGHSAGTGLVVGPVRIDRPRAVPPPMRPLEVRFGQSIHLLGYDATAENPNHVEFRLHWQSDAPLQNDYTTFVHLLDAQGKVVAQDDHQPDGGAYPTSTWRVGETILDRHSIVIPAGAPRPTKVEIGVYFLATGQRLSAFAANDPTPRDAVTFAFDKIAPGGVLSPASSSIRVAVKP